MTPPLSQATLSLEPEEASACESEEFTGAIIFCPVCCSTVDAEGWGAQVHTCVSCESTFAVGLVPAKVQEHSLHG